LLAPKQETDMAPRPYFFFSNRSETPLPGCTPATNAPELPPPLPWRPVQWRRVWSTLRAIRRTPEQTEKAFEMFEAIGGNGDGPLYERFLHSEEGQRLLEERSCLVDLLSDRDALAAMPPGSFGRAYLAFAEENGFAADGLLQARDEGFNGLDDDLDPERQWFFDRLTVMHDLWHVLTGYGTDRAGEAALLAFSRSQGLRGRAITTFLAVAATLGGPQLQRFMFQAWRRGLGSGCLVAQRFEELLPLPVEVVRARLRIAPAHEAHPKGLLLFVNDGLVRVGA
jgi:ubiquinone biosynthesis protein COQ4